MQFYSYLWLREDWTPYYVGKGSGKRAFTRVGHTVNPPKDRMRILVFPKANEVEAFESEKALIAAFGRKDLGTGCLRNRTDGGEGNSGRIFSAEHRRKLGKGAHMARAAVLGGRAVFERKLGCFAIDPELHREMGRTVGRKYGPISGRRAVESGQLAAARRPSMHNRWHVGRGIVNPDCQMCAEAHKVETFKDACNPL